MNLEKIRHNLFEDKTQVFFLSPQGRILESAGNLIRIPPDFSGSLFEEDPLLESLAQMLPIVEPIQLPAVSLQLFGKQGYYDLGLIPSPDQPQFSILSLADLTQEYRLLHNVQQERNEAAIKKEWVELNAEKIRLENELLELKNTQLEQMRQFRMDFFARISHELRTPVNGIVGLARLLQRGTDEQHHNEYLEALSAAGRHLVSLVNDLMDIGKLEAGKITFDHRPFQLSQVVKSVLAIFSFQVGEKQLKLSWESGKDVPDYLVGDSMRLSQILFNLVGNAVKFTEKGSISIKIEAPNKDQSGQVELHISVTDTGIGIPQEQQSRIFELYFQGSNDITRKFGGTGLGLNIARQLVELQGGNIHLKSKEGEGTEISFSLPFAIGQGLEGPVQGNAAKVLVVEDNPMNRMVVAELLKQAGFEVSLAGSGREAMQLLGTQTCDLILTDVNMPEMSGPELLAALRQQNGTWMATVPVVALTGSMLGTLEENGLVGFSEVLEKPVSPELLIRKAVFFTQGIQLATTSVELTQAAGTPSTYLEEVAGGDEGFMAELISVFMDETPTTLETLRRALDAQDGKLLAAEAHRYKANLRYMGLDKAFQKMDNVEQLARTKDWEKINELLAEIKVEAMAALPYLAATVADIRTTQKTKENE